MNFKYKIIDNEVTITGVKDKFTKSIEIPEFIDNLPVTNIGEYAFYNCASLKEINGVDIKEGVNFINNRFIYRNQLIYKILYQICDDYICGYKNIFINGKYLNNILDIYST
jgi:hypothetical protein